MCTARVRSVTLQPASSLTGMQRRVDNLLGLPQLRCHLVRLALLVGYQRPLGLLETRLAHEQRASTPREILVSSCFLVSVPDLPALSSRPRVARLPIVTPCLSCLSADAMPATRRARRYRPGPLADPPPRRAAHLGSVRPAVCRTRPQYVLRSYRDSGRALGPGSEADIVFSFLVGLVRTWSRRRGREGFDGRRVAGKGQEEVSGAPIREWRLSKGRPSCFPSNWCRVGKTRALATATGTAVKGILSKRPKMTPSSVGGRTQRGAHRPMPLLPRPTGAERADAAAAAVAACVAAQCAPAPGPWVAGW